MTASKYSHINTPDSKHLNKRGDWILICISIYSIKISSN